ncbi:MAG: serine hydrolase domain-containing protein [Blastococcus sp.]
MTTIDERGLDDDVSRILNRRPAVGLALGVVGTGGRAEFSAHGVADIASGRPVTEDTVFRVASITKTFTAVALMQLCERGLVDLDAPADDYLRTYRLLPATPGGRPATVRHLLTHTAGIGEEVLRSRAFARDFGESVPAGRPVPTPAEYYGASLRLVAEPGTRFRYTDHGPTTVGQIVEDVSGLPFDSYLREHVFAPLGMTHTDVVRSDRVRERLATGYTLGRGGAKAVADRNWVTVGASNAYSTPRDMGRYVAALLGGGATDHGSVLSPATVAAMFAPQYQPDPRIPGMGLGFFRTDVGGHRVVEHQGLLPGFDSQLFVAPDDGVAVIAFTNGTRRGAMWLPTETGRLLRRLLGAPDDAVRTDVPQHPEIWGDLCGWYSLAGPVTDVRIRGFMGAGAEVLVRAGRLHLRFLTPIPPLYRGFDLHPDDPDDPYVFRLDFSEFGMGRMRLVFGRAPDGRTTAVHFDLMPVSAERRPAGTNPRRWLGGATALATATAVAVRARRRPVPARVGRAARRA